MIWLMLAMEEDSEDEDMEEALVVVTDQSVVTTVDF